MKRWILRILASVGGLYLLAAAGFFWTMHQPPVQFAGIVARLPKAAMYAFGPLFPPLWAVARAGDLNVGDPAPDFDLETHDHSGRVRLSSFRGQRPVALVFGSYT